MSQTPAVGRIVHYVGAGFGEKVCRAAIITEVDGETLRLDVRHPGEIPDKTNVQHDEGDKEMGTWHWPEMV